MRKLTVHLNVWFDDMQAESTDDAADAIKQAIVGMHDHCEAELADALASIGARDVRLETVVF